MVVRAEKSPPGCGMRQLISAYTTPGCGLAK
jgi:hypothetical protein